MRSMHPYNYARRWDDLAGWKVEVVSYQLGKRYRCAVDNVSLGGMVDGDGITREEAETQALNKARDLLLRHAS